MPVASGGIRAIAIPASYESIFISGYTQLVAGAFIACWILIAMAIYSVLPKDLCRHQAVILLSQDSTEPFRAAILMSKFCWHILSHKSGMRRLEAASPTSLPTWTELYVGVLVLLLALGTVIGSVFGGLFLPGKLVIGHVAPVNATMVYILGDYLTSGVHISRPVLRSTRIARAVNKVDSSKAVLESELGDRVMVKKAPAKPGPGGEESYDIHYSFRVDGYEMGLQHMPEYSLNVTGTCSFQYDWYQQTNGTHDTYALFDNTTSLNVELLPWGSARSSLEAIYVDDRREWYSGNYSDGVPGVPFAVVPMTQGNTILLNSRDPWYHTENNPLPPVPFLKFKLYPIKSGRPPLLCDEKHAFYLGNTYLGPDLTLYQGKVVKESDGGDSYAELQVQKRSTVGFSDGLWQLLTNNGTTATPFERRSFDLRNGVSGYRQLGLGSPMAMSVDDGGGSAFADIKRLVYITYIQHRNLLQDAAMNYLTLRQLGLLDQAKNGAPRLNAILDAHGNPLPGVEDFVLPSAQVSTLHLGYIAAVPAGVAFLWMLVGIIVYYQYRQRKRGAVPGEARLSEPRVAGEDGRVNT